MDGSKCIGEFKDGKHNGFSIYHSVNGKIDEQYSENGQHKSIYLKYSYGSINA